MIEPGILGFSPIIRTDPDASNAPSVIAIQQHTHEPEEVWCHFRWNRAEGEGGRPLRATDEPARTAPSIPGADYVGGVAPWPRADRKKQPDGERHDANAAADRPAQRPYIEGSCALPSVALHRRKTSSMG